MTRGVCPCYAKGLQEALCIDPASAQHGPCQSRCQYWQVLGLPPGVTPCSPLHCASPSRSFQCPKQHGTQLSERRLFVSGLRECPVGARWCIARVPQPGQGWEQP